MMNEIYVLDSNSLITAYKHFYSFSIAPHFWDIINLHAENGSILTIDKVKEEICCGTKDKKDALQEWFELNFCGEVIKIKEHDSIINSYQEILNYILNSEKYDNSALNALSISKVADPWLIATGKALGYTIVTFEVSSNSPKKPKIPDFCNHFSVKYVNLFKMMDQMKITLN